MSSTSSAYRRGAEALARGSWLDAREAFDRRFAKKKRPLRSKDSGSPRGGWTLPMLSSNPANAHTGYFSTRRPPGGGASGGVAGMGLLGVPWGERCRQRLAPACPPFARRLAGLRRARLARMS